jgi:CHASE3 domain sensor protein
MQGPSYTKQVIIFIFVLGILALISSALLTYMSFKDRAGSQTDKYNSYYRNEIIESIYSSLTEAEASRRGYFITNDKQYLSPYIESKKTADSLMGILKPLVLENSAQSENYNSLKSLIAERFKLFDEGIQLQGAKGNNQKIHSSIMDKGRIVQSDLKALINKMRGEEDKIIRSKNQTNEDSYIFAKYAILGGISISCIIFIGIFIVLFKKSSKAFEFESQEISREELETIVRERTAEISQINRKLYGKVDELVAMDKALKQSEEYYRMLFEQAHDAIIIFSPEGEVVLDVNNRACELYGFTREEFIGLSLKTISKNVPQGERHIDDTLKKGY